MEIFKAIIKKNKRLFYIYIFLKGFFNNKFVMTVTDESRNSNFNLVRYGSVKNLKIVYLINLNDLSGLFAHIIWILKYLYIANDKDFYPIIFIGKDNVYFDESYSNETGIYNVVEYFFKVNYGEFCSELNSIKYINVVEASREHIFNFESKYNGYNGVYNTFKSENFITEMALMFSKYLIFNEEILKKARLDFLRLNIQSTYLAVHFRGTDFNYNLKGHPKIVDVKTYFSAIDEIMAHLNYLNLFIATDDTRILDEFKKKYGNNLMYFEDSSRSSNNTGVQYLNDGSSGFLKGYEAVRDLLLLANADSIVCGLSSLPTVARIYKKSKGEDFVKMIILDKGVNSSGRSLRFRDSNFKSLIKRKHF